MKHLLPTENDVKRMLAALFGDELVVGAGASDVGESYVAVYVDAENQPGAVICCDSSFAAYAGAALSMLPPDAATDAANSGDLSATMRENLHEVMNICTGLLIGESTPHLRLTELCRLDETDAPDAIKEVSSSSCFNVVIPRYGAGQLKFLVT